MPKFLGWPTGVLFALLPVSVRADQAISFLEPRTFVIDAPASLDRIISGDWNGDGRLDLAAVSGQSLLIFEGDSFGGFRLVSQLPLVHHFPSQIAAVDLNSDGRTDVLTYYCVNEFPNCVPSGEFAAYLSEGDFHFSSPIRFRPKVSTAQGPPGGPYILGFQIADLNGDGTPDLLLVLNSPGRDSVVLGRGDGTFADPIPGPYTFTLVGVADFNSDGVPDVMTRGFYANAPQIYYGRGDGTFEPPVGVDICEPGFSGCWMQLAYVDVDGAPDLLVGDASWGWTGNLRLLRGNGHGGFELLSRLPDSLAGDDHTGFILEFTDLNRDRIPDLIRVRSWYVDDGSDNLAGIYKGNDNGDYSLSVEVRLPYHGRSLLVDVNGDGRPDLVASDGDRRILVFLNDGSNKRTHSVH